MEHVIHRNEILTENVTFENASFAPDSSTSRKHGMAASMDGPYFFHVLVKIDHKTVAKHIVSSNPDDASVGDMLLHNMNLREWLDSRHIHSIRNFTKGDFDQTHGRFETSTEIESSTSLHVA